ncbi:MAG: hypothetical protein HY537_03250 [Deltaproteobacteria bacterium]|nr:hypothetical protein [Deltaproteobacteria bacterium]
MKLDTIKIGLISFLCVFIFSAKAEWDEGAEPVAVGDYATCQARRTACGENSMPCSQAYIACIDQAQGSQNTPPVISGFDPFAVGIVRRSPNAHKVEHHYMGQGLANHLIAAQRHLGSGDASKAVHDLETRHSFIWGGHAAKAQVYARQAADALVNGNINVYENKSSAAQYELAQAQRLHPELFPRNPDWKAGHLISAEKALQSGNAAKAAFDLATRHSFIWGGHAAKAQVYAQQATDAFAAGNIGLYLQKLTEAKRELNLAKKLHPERF